MYLFRVPYLSEEKILLAQFLNTSQKKIISYYTKTSFNSFICRVNDGIISRNIDLDPKWECSTKEKFIQFISTHNEINLTS